MNELSKLIQKFQHMKFKIACKRCEMKVGPFLGFGHYSIVFLCSSEITRQKIAVKVIKLLEDLDQYQIDDMKVILQKLIKQTQNYQNVIPLLEYQFLTIDVDRYLCIFEEYCQFGSLRNYLTFQFEKQRQKPSHNLLDPVLSFRIILQCIVILQDLHERQQVHGGIGLNNFMVVNAQNLSIRLADVGLYQLKKYFLPHEKELLTYLYQQQQLQPRVRMQKTIQTITEESYTFVDLTTDSLNNKEILMQEDVSGLESVVYFLITGKHNQSESRPPLPAIFNSILDFLYNSENMMGCTRYIGIQELANRVWL